MTRTEIINDERIIQSMKGLFKSLLVVSLAMFAFTALAQFDMFSVPRTTIVLPQTILTQSSTTELDTAGDTIDLRGYEGVGELVLTCTNTSGSSPKIYVYAETSADRTNWTTVATWANATKASQTITNWSWAVAQKATNTVFTPGTLTAATAATAGFAGTYMVPAAATSTAICTNVAGGTFVSGIAFNTLNRYFRLETVVTGDTSVFTVGAVLIGRKQYGGY